MAVAGDLVVNLTGKTTGLKKATGRGLGMIKDFSGGAINMLGRIGLAAQGLREIFNVTRAAFNALLSPVKKFASFGDSLDKVSARTGVSVKALSLLRFVASQVGSDFETLEKGMFGLSRSVFDLSLGLSTSKDAFGALGLELKDLKGLKPERQLGLIADAMKKVSDISVRGAIAQKIFGRAGRQLLPMLALGAKGIKEMTDKAERMGLAVTASQATAAAAFTDAWDLIKQQFGAALFQIGDAIAQTFNLTDTMTMFSAFAASFKSDWLPAIKGVLLGLRDAWNNTVEFISSIWTGIFGGGGDLLGDLKFFFTTFDLQMKLGAAKIRLFIENIPTLFRNMATNALEIIVKLGRSIAKVFANLFKQLHLNSVRFAKSMFKGDKGFKFEFDFDLLRGARKGFEDVGKLITKGIKKSTPEIERILRLIQERVANQNVGGGDGKVPGPMHGVGSTTRGAAGNRSAVEGALRGSAAVFSRALDLNNAAAKAKAQRDKANVILQKIEENTRRKPGVGEITDKDVADLARVVAFTQ